MECPICRQTFHPAGLSRHFRRAHADDQLSEFALEAVPPSMRPSEADWNAADQKQKMDMLWKTIKCSKEEKASHPGETIAACKTCGKVLRRPLAHRCGREAAAGPGADSAATGSSIEPPPAASVNAESDGTSIIDELYDKLPPIDINLLC